MSQKSKSEEIDNSGPQGERISSDLDFWDIDVVEESITDLSKVKPRGTGELFVNQERAVEINSQVPSDPTINQVSAPPANEPTQRTENNFFQDFPELDATQPDVKSDEATSIPVEEKKPAVVIPSSVVPPSVAFTKIEKIALLALCAICGFGAIFVLMHFSSTIPTRALIAEKIDFPVFGKIIKIMDANTYWREPLTTDGSGDVVSIESKLIPVLKLNLGSKSGAIRVFFRNDEGFVVGDSITRTLKGETELIISATAGFEDVSMHAAYRVGDGKDWIVQVFEGPSATAPVEKFHKVLEMEMSRQIQ
jgi:hypothetical protein